MKSWISIPFYLWKNTLRRWLEYPASPVSKAFIPILLGFLSLLVLGLFAAIERELSAQLDQSQVFTVVSSEFVQGDSAPTILSRTYEEEMLWQARFPDAFLVHARQPLLSANFRGKNLPVMAMTAGSEALAPRGDHEQPPATRLLTRDPSLCQPREQITFGNLRLLTEVNQSPEWMTRDLGTDEAVVADVTLAHSALQKGFIHHVVARLQNLNELRRYVDEMRAYYRAENRRVKTVSAVEILENLERIRRFQFMAKTLILISCCSILSFTLGSIAWLEYRQDAYLLALLRSFGTPVTVLWCHMLLENLILVLGGIMLVWTTWASLCERALPKLQQLGMQAQTVPQLGTKELWVLLAAGTAGVMLAMTPVAFALRRQPGLILQ